MIFHFCKEGGKKREERGQFIPSAWLGEGNCANVPTKRRLRLEGEKKRAVLHFLSQDARGEEKRGRSSLFPRGRGSPDIPSGGEKGGVQNHFFPERDLLQVEKNLSPFPGNHHPHKEPRG